MLHLGAKGAHRPAELERNAWDPVNMMETEVLEKEVFAAAMVLGPLIDLGFVVEGSSVGLRATAKVSGAPLQWREAGSQR